MEITHTPVLLEETIQYLAPKSGAGLMVDATMGEGGHCYAFLSRFPGLRVIGVDADKSIQAVARERLKEFSARVEWYTGWSQTFFEQYPLERERPGTVLADLGISMFHYEKSGRGFSFRGDEKLDMRLDDTEGVSAADLVARLPEKELADLLYHNAGERYSRRIAKVIVDQRQRGIITTTAALVELVERAVPASYRHGPIHPATRTFQALRIAVNGELSRLPGLLEGALKVLEPGGRLGVISFHSVEDGIVKNFFRLKNRDCTCPPEAPVCRCSGRRAVNILTRKGIAPGEAEIQRNPPSRSARLRVVEKVLDGGGL
ncbi:MAG: 16S rRNA (cytosine(1402)-N(4))-methyltransferase RsmH [Treponema sp.]|jgi:16S rRNA (cytosine1402-N4)-methyltransferase|nr:16S rRNA (cytosine(1402)-N(4))-methyltransferase RsmH [Treponema sp.]